MMTTLFLARHGETVDNARQVMQGQTQGKLNENGMRQAEDLARRMATEGIDAVLSSDLNRAVQTATIVARHLQLDLTTTPLLRERDWGTFTGRYIPSLKGEPFPDDVETMDCLLDRARRFLLFVSSHYPGQRVLAVGHGIVNKAIQAVHFGKLMRQVERMTNAEVRVLQLPS